MPEAQFEIQHLIESEMERYDLLEGAGMLTGANYRTRPEHLAIALNEWLADHDKEVAARAWDEGHSHCFHVENPKNQGNPYRGDNR